MDVWEEPVSPPGALDVVKSGFPFVIFLLLIWNLRACRGMQSNARFSRVLTFDVDDGKHWCKTKPSYWLGEGGEEEHETGGRLRLCCSKYLPCEVVSAPLCPFSPFVHRRKKKQERINLCLSSASTPSAVSAANKDLLLICAVTFIVWDTRAPSNWCNTKFSFV